MISVSRSRSSKTASNNVPSFAFSLTQPSCGVRPRITRPFTRSTPPSVTLLSETSITSVFSRTPTCLDPTSNSARIIASATARYFFAATFFRTASSKTVPSESWVLTQPYCTRNCMTPLSSCLPSNGLTLLGLRCVPGSNSMIVLDSESKACLTLTGATTMYSSASSCTTAGGIQSSNPLTALSSCVPSPAITLIHRRSLASSPCEKQTRQIPFAVFCVSSTTNTCPTSAVPRSSESGSKRRRTLAGAVTSSFEPISGPSSGSGASVAACVSVSSVSLKSVSVITVSVISVVSVHSVDASLSVSNCVSDMLVSVSNSVSDATDDAA